MPAAAPARRKGDGLSTVALPLGRLHFAGEHTALASPGMEGACESADRAVAELLARA